MGPTYRVTTAQVLITPSETTTRLTATSTRTPANVGLSTVVCSATVEVTWLGEFEAGNREEELALPERCGIHLNTFLSAKANRPYPLFKFRFQKQEKSPVDRSQQRALPPDTGSLSRYCLGTTSSAAIRRIQLWGYPWCLCGLFLRLSASPKTGGNLAEICKRLMTPTWARRSSTSKPSHVSDAATVPPAPTS